MKKLTLTKAALAVLLFSGASSAMAKDMPLTLGVGAMFGPDIWTDADRRTQAIPIVQFKYGRFYAQGGNFGFNLVDTSGIEVGINLNARFEGFDPDDANGVLKGYEDRDPAFEAGIRAAISDDFGKIEMILATDISDKHEGDTASIEYSYMFGNRSVSLVPFIGATYRSQEVVQYYYGINPGDIDGATCTPEEDAKGYCSLYAGDDTWSINLGAKFAYRFTKAWSMSAKLEYETYDDEIEDSPLVDDDAGLHGFVGIAYTF